MIDFARLFGALIAFMPTSERTIGRLSLYRRLLKQAAADGQENVYSHELGARAGATACQVRRDLMGLGCAGSPSRGYKVKALLERIDLFLDAPDVEPVAIVGIGNLGRAILSFFQRRRPKLEITAAFDSDPWKVDRVVQGVRCHALADIERVVKEQGITLAVLTVPAGAAQEVADTLVAAGIKGIMNFAPAPLRVPLGVFVEDMDLAMSLEKVAYFARGRGGAPRKGGK